MNKNLMNKYKVVKKEAIKTIKGQIVEFNKHIDKIKKHSINNNKDYLAKKKLKVFLKKKKRLILYLEKCVKEIYY